jgi:hypothetical protein
MVLQPQAQLLVAQVQAMAVLRVSVQPVLALPQQEPEA